MLALPLPLALPLHLPLPVPVRFRITRRLAVLSLLLLAASCSSGDRASSEPNRSRPRHALVVGGTGMLRKVSLELATRGYTTSVIARSRGPLEELVAKTGGRVNPIALDYGDTDHLILQLEKAIGSHGPIELVVAWIHSDAPEAPLAVARTAAMGGHGVHYFDVVGSAADDPSGPDPARRDGFAAVSGLVYHEIILGFILERGASRWLTHDEIAAGVLAAIDSGAPRSIVGTTRPWSARP